MNFWSCATYIYVCISWRLQTKCILSITLLPGQQHYYLGLIRCKLLKKDQNNIKLLLLKSSSSSSNYHHQQQQHEIETKFYSANRRNFTTNQFALPTSDEPGVVRLNPAINKVLWLNLNGDSLHRAFVCYHNHFSIFLIWLKYFWPERKTAKCHPSQYITKFNRPNAHPHKINSEVNEEKLPYPLSIFFRNHFHI